jgi:hypothetical protein
MAVPVFTHVSVQPLLVDRTVVTWDLHPAFKEPGPYRFEVDFSRSGNPDATNWDTVGQAVNSGYAEMRQRGWSTLENWFYRVRLILPDAREFSSSVAPAWGDLPRVERLAAREMTRRMNLGLIKGTGTSGVLLRRKQWGPRCTKCLDKDTLETTDGMCPECYATGLVGGYDPPLFMPLLFAAGETSEPTQSEMGTTDTRTLQASGVALLCPRANDLWVSSLAGHRFRIRRSWVATRLRDTPVEVGVTLSKLPNTDIAQQVAASQ